MKWHLYIITTCIICVNKSILCGFLVAFVIITAKRDICRDVTVTSGRLEKPSNTGSNTRHGQRPISSLLIWSPTWFFPTEMGTFSPAIKRSGRKNGHTPYLVPSLRMCAAVLHPPYVVMERCLIKIRTFYLLMQPLPFCQIRRDWPPSAEVNEWSYTSTNYPFYGMTDRHPF